VNAELVLSIQRIVELIIPERNIGYGEVKEVHRKAGCFKAHHPYVSVRAELFGDPSGEGVEFYS